MRNNLVCAYWTRTGYFPRLPKSCPLFGNSRAIREDSTNVEIVARARHHAQPSAASAARPGGFGLPDVERAALRR